eukprot:3743225-Ditylum_brightwellii.AAC.1
MFNDTQKIVIGLCQEAKTAGSTDVDLVNIENKLKFTRNQVHYMKKLAKQVKNLYATLVDEGNQLLKALMGH